MTNTPPGALPLPVVPGLTDLEVFARGGYATVYRATQASVGREVAVKVENRTLDSERDQRRFLREARAAGRMSSHPHVVDLFDAGVTADQHPYLIMELCDGSYAERMRRSPLSAVEARDVGVKIADALADAHQLGVLHRDVKPANILHSRFNPAVLADFGLAVLAEARDSSVTLEVLTPAYAPPEMFRHQPPSPAVDVYALCATLYAVMHGKPPRWQTDRNPSLITLMELFSHPIPDLPGIPVELTGILRAGMANNPADRPTAEQLRDLLAAVPLGPAGAAAPTSGAPTSGGPSGTPTSGAPVSGSPVTPTSGGTGGGIYLSHSYTTTSPTMPTPLSPPTPPVSPAHPSAPSPRPAVSEPDHPTVNTTGPTGPTGYRPLHWVLGGVGLVALLVGVGAGSWYAARHSGPGPDPTPTAVSRSTGVPTLGSTLGGGVLPGCLVGLPGGARCPTELECFGPVRISGSKASANRVPCAGRHTWEVFALGDLPDEVTPVDHPTVKADPLVRQVCGENTFRLATGLMTVADWRFEVLPPQAGALSVGDRVFRCLAGKGVDQLSAPTLAR